MEGFRAVIWYKVEDHFLGTMDKNKAVIDNG
jgi:hypothetical protein